MLRDVGTRSYRGAGEHREPIDRRPNAVRAGELTRLLSDRYRLSAHADSWAMRAHAAVHRAGTGAGLAVSRAGGSATPRCIDDTSSRCVMPTCGRSSRARNGDAVAAIALAERSVRNSDVGGGAPRVRCCARFADRRCVYGSIPDRERRLLVHGAGQSGRSRTRDDSGRRCVAVATRAQRRELARRVALTGAGARESPRGARESRRCLADPRARGSRFSIGFGDAASGTASTRPPRDGDRACVRRQQSSRIDRCAAT